MRIYRVSATPEHLLDANNSDWHGIAIEKIPLIPSMVELAGTVSPYLSRSHGHGITREIAVQMAHDGQFISVRMEWPNPAPKNEIADLDQFADAAAVMFTAKDIASAISMGAKGAPVNAWLWKADEKQPFDVIAEGYANSQRRSASTSSLVASQQYNKANSIVVLQRPLTSPEESCVSFEPGTITRVAFAVWSGANKERSGQKSVSGEFVRTQIDS